MFSIGEDMGSPRLMALLGLVLDLAKCATPIFVCFLWAQRRYLASSFALFLSLILSVVSFSASVAALESGVVGNAKNSVSYQRIDTQITDYRAQIIELRQLADKQQQARLITKSQLTVALVPALLSRIDELYSQQENFSGGDSVVSKYGMLISYVTAAALELLSWLFVCVSNALLSAKHCRSRLSTVVHTEQILSVQSIGIPIEHTKTQSQLFTFNTHLSAVNDASFNLVCRVGFLECDRKKIKSKCDAQLYLDVRDAILSKEVKPSYRGICRNFKGVGRDLIASVLRDLFDAGFLKPYRNGYQFV